MKSNYSSNRILIVLIVSMMVLTGIAAFASHSVDAAYHEPFDTDVFSTGDWTRSDSSVTIDETNGWLHMGPDGNYDDFAEKTVSYSLPIILETRWRLVSGGRDYRLPWLVLLFDSGGSSHDMYMSYLPDANTVLGGWNFNGWTLITENGPSGENVWCTIRAEIRSDGGELQAKNEGDTTFATITSRTWSIPDTLVKIRYEQPWDSVCDVDYLSIQTSPEATIDIDPDTLNLKSKGKWITCYIDLPEGYNVNNIDIGSILLEDTIPAEWGDIQGDILMVKFHRNEVEDMLFVGAYNLKVTGELTDGTPFEGYSDEIRVINPP